MSSQLLPAVVGRTRRVARPEVAAVLALLALAPGAVTAAVLTQGPNPPGTMASNNSFGTAPWTNTGSAVADDSIYAVTAPGGSPTQYLRATNFGFDIPAPAEIRGIEVLVDRRSVGGTITDARARIVKGGVTGSTDRALAGTWALVETVASYGSPTDLWGETWTAAEINDSGFGFALAVTDSFDTAGVDAIRIVVHYSLCAGVPLGGCRTAGKSILLLKNDSPDTKDKLIWKWIKGANTSQVEFGDPVATASYALCVYAGSAAAVISEALIEPGAAWSPIGDKGYKYLDKPGAQDGIQKIVLKGSSGGKSKVLVKGKGANLSIPTPPLALPITVQLRNSDSGICWEGVFATLADVKKNVPGQFKGNAQ